MTAWVKSTSTATSLRPRFLGGAARKTGGVKEGPQQQRCPQQVLGWVSAKKNRNSPGNSAALAQGRGGDSFTADLTILATLACALAAGS